MLRQNRREQCVKNSQASAALSAKAPTPIECLIILHILAISEEKPMYIFENDRTSKFTGAFSIAFVKLFSALLESPYILIPIFPHRAKNQNFRGKINFPQCFSIAFKFHITLM